MSNRARRLYRGRMAVTVSNDANVNNTASGENEMADEVVTKKASLVTKKGKTRGKNPRDIEYQAFDLEQPETLPRTYKEFVEVTGLKEEADIVSVLIDGFNQQAYSAASDEIGEFVNDAWDKEFTNQFRLVIRNHSKMTGMGVEETVNLLKPGIEKAWEAKKAKAAEETAKA
jgi:hypothetical protein